MESSRAAVRLESFCARSRRLVTAVRTLRVANVAKTLTTAEITDIKTAFLTDFEVSILLSTPATEGITPNFQNLDFMPFGCFCLSLRFANLTLLGVHRRDG